MQIHSKTSKLIDNAVTCFQWGYFEGCLRYCETLEGAYRESPTRVRHIAWLSRVYLGGLHRKRAIAATRDAIPIALFSNKEYLAERLVLEISAGRTQEVAEGINLLLTSASTKAGLRMWHPTAALELAEFALSQLKDEVTSLKLVNIALGYPNVYVVLSDVDRLARLLAGLNAPPTLWVDWANILLRHIRLSTHRAGFLKKALGAKIAIHWALGEDAASESVLKRTLAIAPSELHAILMRLAPALGHPQLSQILQHRFTPSGIAARTNAVSSLWFDPVVLKLRYFWHDALEPEEQFLLRNGEWAMFNTPTADFSMALAQWWRLIESILKRSLAKELCSLFQSHPDWIEWDRRNLTERVRKREAVFVNRLAESEGWRTLTLGELLRILQKCFPPRASSDHNDAGGSRLRKEAVRFVRNYCNHFGELVSEQLGHVAHLTEQNVDLFRNRPSHNCSVDIIDAAVGRMIGRSIIDISFGPLLEAQSYAPMLDIGGGEMRHAVKAPLASRSAVDSARRPL
ncbi:hypothetical protein [Paraburkholderia sp.]|uniref:hypothetical protein n=1 Tax=Paraburkholderia sp. TaxID=1926495 RepID=UPI002392B16D|nr:hypothetical protein [Paraburkholderia sp.]MDE1181485.1 hypothetical protein [Paraburkholderia sp.]